MNFLANLLKILIILVIVAVVAVIIMMGAMVLFPSFSLFGIHYVNGDSKNILYYYDVTHADNVAEWASVDTLYVETGNWDVYVYSNEVAKDLHTEQGIDIKVTRNYIGFASNSVGEAKLSKYTYEERKDGNYLCVYMTEPTGWLSRFDSSLYVYLDEEMMADKQLMIKTNGGKVVLGEAIKGGSHQLTLESVKIDCGGGQAYIQNVEILDSLVVEKDSGNLNVAKNLNCDVSISIPNGLGNAYLKNVGTETEPKDLVIENTNNSGIYFDTVYGNLLVKANSGLVKGNLVTETIVMDAESCNLELGEVMGNVFFDNVNGSLKLNKANEVVCSITGKGGANIAELHGTSMFDCANGAVTVGKVYKDIFVNTINGNIDLVNEDSSKVNYVLESENGAVSVKNVRGSVKFNTINSGKAKFYASYWELIGANSVNTFSGEINIDMLDAGYGFMLADWQTGSSVYFKLSRFEEFGVKDSSENDAYKNGVKIGGYAGTTDALSIISNVGALRVVHPDLV